MRLLGLRMLDGSDGEREPPGRRPTTVRERLIEADIQEVWRVVEDPHHMPRWWPGVKRMEGVEPDRFTQVYTTKRGRPVRMDFRVVAHEPPYRRAWAQDMEGTPFERVVSESVIEITLAAVGLGTRVVLAQRQKLRGYSRTGTLLVRRASGEKLDEALEALDRVVGLTP